MCQTDAGKLNGQRKMKMVISKMLMRFDINMDRFHFYLSCVLVGLRIKNIQFSELTSEQINSVMGYSCVQIK